VEYNRIHGAYRNKDEYIDQQRGRIGFIPKVIYGKNLLVPQSSTVKNLAVVSK
jgi:hypothetical protein